MNLVTNRWGVQVDFDAAYELMDQRLVQCLQAIQDFDSDQEFFDAYCCMHHDYYGETFEPNKPNPVM